MNTLIISNKFLCLVFGHDLKSNTRYNYQYLDLEDGSIISNFSSCDWITWISETNATTVETTLSSITSTELINTFPEYFI